jgi:hypothetical protein
MQASRLFQGISKLFHYTGKLKSVRQNRFRKHIELCMISLDGGSKVGF